ncbi:MAG: hypothetical protein JNL72_02435 [Flavipsychrobacter sp.]|nr:hypothetical protein [Flavipsychrobacter sp.]
MQFEIAKDIYEHKYQDRVSLDNYLEHVEHGLNLLENQSGSTDIQELEDMNLALEYNMEVMLKHLM